MSSCTCTNMLVNSWITKSLSFFMWTDCMIIDLSEFLWFKFDFLSVRLNLCMCNHHLRWFYLEKLCPGECNNCIGSLSYYLFWV
jgi:hypothetical protein